MTYEEIKAQARERANATGYDQGIEKLGNEYRTWMLPGVKYRFGHELRCEVVHCDIAANVKPGHGVNAR